MSLELRRFFALHANNFETERIFGVVALFDGAQLQVEELTWGDNVSLLVAFLDLVHKAFFVNDKVASFHSFQVFFDVQKAFIIQSLKTKY